MKALSLSLLALASVCALACSRPKGSDASKGAEAVALPTSQRIDMAPIQSGSAPAGGLLSNPYGSSDSPDDVGDASTEMDPNRVFDLKPLDELEPKPEREGVISFSRLSLAGTDVESLLDHLFPLTGEDPPPYDYPEEVAALDGTEVKIVGYMIPLEWSDKKVTEFMLVRDLAACCFGGIPRPDEWAFVSLPEGEGVEYFVYVPVLVTGKLKLYPLKQPKQAVEGEETPSEGAESALSGDETAPEAPTNPLDIESVFSLVATKVERY
ncbi:MAG: hypothetical protein ACI8QC_000990 [Planctomycetota bacterium]|jgi:hypothetical protein